jgi:hypothetical protein
MHPFVPRDCIACNLPIPRANAGRVQGEIHALLAFFRALLDAFLFDLGRFAFR